MVPPIYIPPEPNIFEVAMAISPENCAPILRIRKVVKASGSSESRQRQYEYAWVVADEDDLRDFKTMIRDQAYALRETKGKLNRTRTYWAITSVLFILYFVAGIYA